MPFDAFGNFTRVHNWTADKLAGIKIQSVRMDAEFDNFAVAMNQVVLRNGSTPWTGDLKLGGNSITGLEDGTAAVPSLSFLDDPNTGMFSAGQGAVSFASAGTWVGNFSGSGLQVTGQINASAAVIANPAGAALYLDSPAGNQRQVNFRTGTSARWQVIVTAEAESGANAGSNFYLARYDDAGAFLGYPFYITRSTGNAQFTNSVGVTGTINAATMSATNIGGTNISVVGGVLQISTNATNIDGQLYMDAPAGKNKLIMLRTGTISRWQIYSDSAAETGADAGSNFNIAAFTDAGAYASTPIYIYRKTGVVQFAKAPIFTDNAGTRASMNIGSGKVGSGNIPAGTVTLAIPLGGYNTDGKSGEVKVRWAHAGTIAEPYMRITDPGGVPISGSSYVYSNHTFGSNGANTFESTGGGSSTIARIMGNTPNTGWDNFMTLVWWKGAGGSFNYTFSVIYNVGGYTYTTVGGGRCSYASDVPYLIIGTPAGTTIQGGEWHSKADTP